jgi:hypothetical protein
MPTIRRKANRMRPNFEAEVLPLGHDASQRQDVYKVKGLNIRFFVKDTNNGREQQKNDEKETYTSVDGSCRAVLVLWAERDGLCVF